MKRFKKQKNITGFTLIETLVAVTVLVSALVGPLTIASRGLFAASLAQNRMVASFLAQEAIEYVRNTRDTNALRGDYWLEGLDKCTEGNVCQISIPIIEEVYLCPGSGCTPIRYNNDASVYGGYNQSDATGWKETIFTREIRVEDQLLAEIEAKVTVTVSWKERSSNKSVTITEYLFNWQSQPASPPEE